MFCLKDRRLFGGDGGGRGNSSNRGSQSEYGGRDEGDRARDAKAMRDRVANGNGQSDTQTTQEKSLQKTLKDEVAAKALAADKAPGTPSTSSTADENSVGISQTVGRNRVNVSLSKDGDVSVSGTRREDGLNLDASGTLDSRGNLKSAQASVSGEADVAGGVKAGLQASGTLDSRGNLKSAQASVSGEADVAEGVKGGLQAGATVDRSGNVTEATGGLSVKGAGWNFSLGDKYNPKDNGHTINGGFSINTDKVGLKDGKLGAVDKLDSQIA
jgi:hypothetical protein